MESSFTSTLCVGDKLRQMNVANCPRKQLFQKRKGKSIIDKVNIFPRLEDKTQIVTKYRDNTDRRIAELHSAGSAKLVTTLDLLHLL
jgi:hypothetical protein